MSLLPLLLPLPIVDEGVRAPERVEGGVLLSLLSEEERVERGWARADEDEETAVAAAGTSCALTCRADDESAVVCTGDGETRGVGEAGESTEGAGNGVIVAAGDEEEVTEGTGVARVV